MAKIVVKSAKFGIVVKELDTANYQDRAVLIRDLLQAIPDADWFEERSGNNGDSNISTPRSLKPTEAQESSLTRVLAVREAAVPVRAAVFPSNSSHDVID